MLQRAMRLRKRRDFQAVYRTRRVWSTPCLALHVRGGVNSVRFGFVISTKVAKRAHVRNLLKRRMREISRNCARGEMTAGDIVFVARTPALALGFEELAAEMLGLMCQAGLVTKTGEDAACGTS